MNKRTILVPLIFAATAFGGWWFAQNFNDINDWWVVTSNPPSIEIQQLAADTRMTDKSERYFYASQPELLDKQGFNESCTHFEQSLVLGCYNGSRIYILSVNENALAGIEEVTAAHEMLHAAYRRLDDTEKRRVDELLKKEFARSKDKALAERIAKYEQNDPTSVNNELHSVFGTEKSEISPDLERYYQQYFEDRQVVVALAEDYEEVFTDLIARISNYDQRLKELNIRIDSQAEQLKNLNAEIDALQAEMDELEQNNQVEQYNALVPRANQQITSFNNVLTQYESSIEEYNLILKDRNKIALYQNNLIQSLDSQYQER